MHHYCCHFVSLFLWLNNSSFQLKLANRAANYCCSHSSTSPAKWTESGKWETLGLQFPSTPRKRKSSSSSSRADASALSSEFHHHYHRCCFHRFIDLLITIAHCCLCSSSCSGTLPTTQRPAPIAAPVSVAAAVALMMLPQRGHFASPPLPLSPAAFSISLYANSFTVGVCQIKRLCVWKTRRASRLADFTTHWRRQTKSRRPSLLHSHSHTHTLRPINNSRYIVCSFELYPLLLLLLLFLVQLRISSSLKEFAKFLFSLGFKQK